MFYFIRHSIIALFISTAVGIVVTLAVFRAENARLLSEVEQELTSMVAEASRSLTQGTTLLNATHAFLITRTADISRDRFFNYVNDLQLTGVKAGLHGVGISLEVNDENRDNIAARLQRDYGPEISIWPDISKARSSIVLLEPLNEVNKRAIGFDMLSEARREEAMTLALQKPGLVQATAPLRLVQETADSSGLVLYLYLNGEKSGMPKGWVYAPMRAKDLFQNAQQATNSKLELRVFDTQEPDVSIFQSEGYKAESSGFFTVQTNLAVAGREWTLIGHSIDKRYSLGRHIFTLITLALMAVIAITSTLAVHGLSQAVARARRLSEAQEQLMREKDLHLREMSHRIKNSLTRVAAMARQAARGSESKEEFTASMNARLQAMANASDVLIRSDGGGAELHELLQMELDQIKGDHEIMPVDIRGPSIKLDSRETQALGLSFHELATNSLKYGAGAIEGSRVDITWSIAPSPKKGKYLLKMRWDEQTNQPAVPPQTLGFGTQLLNNCIKLELGGKLHHHYHDKGLTIELEVHLNQPK